MSRATPSGQRYAPLLLSVFRIIFGLLFFSHGVAKLFGFPPGAQPANVPIASMLGVAGILELVGGAAIILGLFTRPVAFLLSGQMAVAYFMVHLPNSFYPLINGGEAAILYCFGFLYLSAAGPGPWSIDAARR